MSDTSRIDAYLDTLSKALRRLAEADRAAIVDEIAAHLEHRAGEGKLDQALASLGTPKTCARRFREELSLQAAFDDGSPARTMGALLGLAARRTLAALGLLFSGLFLISAVAMAGTTIAELVSPQATGLWIGDNELYFGMADEAARSALTEMLGLWYVPVSAILAVALFVISQWIGRFFLRLMLKRTRAAAGYGR